MDWYVIFVKTGQEEEVQSWLSFYFNNNEFRSLIPKRKLIEKRCGMYYQVLKKLFPGYIFVNTNMTIDKYKIIRKIPDVIRILNTGNYYSKIDLNEIALILKLIGDDEIIDYTKVFIEDSMVKIKEGPLSGMEGIVKKIDLHRNRAKILLNLMGETKTLDVGIEILNKNLDNRFV